MPIEVICSECRKILRVGDHVAGKKIRCPGCQAVETVLESAAPAAMSADKGQVWDRRADEDGPTQNRRSPERSSMEDSPVDFSDKVSDSYEHEAVLPPVPRSRHRKSGAKTVSSSGNAGENSLLRKHWRESMAAAAIAAIWCGLAGPLVFLAGDDIEGIDPAQARNFAVTMLIFSGTLIVAALSQIPKIIPILLCLHDSCRCHWGHSCNGGRRRRLADDCWICGLLCFSPQAAIGD